MFDIIQGLVYRVTGVQRVAMDTEFIRDLGLNSFDIINLICAMEERFDIEIPTRDIPSLVAVKDVMAYLSALHCGEE